jgi:acetyl esterase/lipase
MRRMSSSGAAQLFAHLQATQPASPAPADMRAWFREVTKVCAPPADSRLEPAAASVPASWITPPGADAGHVILYLHGGAYIIGSPETHHELIYRFARAAGARALAVDYRLAPEHPYPAGVEDSVAAYRWLLAQGTPPERVAIAGDSAGGGLTVAALLALRAAGDPLPGCAVCFSPWVDFTGSGASVKTNAGKDPFVDPTSMAGMAVMVLGGKDPAANSPLFGDLSRLPPLFVQVGSDEVLLDDARRLVARANESGGRAVLDVWEHMVHSFQAFPAFMPEAVPAVERAGSFVRAHLG